MLSVGWARPWRKEKKSSGAFQQRPFIDKWSTICWSLFEYGYSAGAVLKGAEMENNSEPSAKPSLTLSIVSHGDGQKIMELLDSLRTFEPDRQFQLILTDNLGKDLPEASGFPGFSVEMLRNQRPQGFASNHNRAFELARADYFCIINPDVIFSEPVFNDLIATQEKSGADVIAPLIVDSAGAPQDSYRLLPKPLDLIKRQLPGYRFTPIPPDVDGLVRPDWIAGIFMLFKSKTYHRMQGFDERYHLYFEDVDLCTRARLAGLKLVVDTRLRIKHNARRASRKSLTYLLWHLRSAVRFYRSKVYRQAIRL